MTTRNRVENFFSSYLSVPIVILFYISHKLYYRTRIVEPMEMDLLTGRRELDIRQLLAEERAERTRWPLWKRVYKLFC
jgi:yeast amino acid transporter